MQPTRSHGALSVRVVLFPALMSILALGGCEPLVSSLVRIDSDLEPGVDADALDIRVWVLVDGVWVPQNGQRVDLAVPLQQVLITRGREGDTVRAEIAALLGEEEVLTVSRSWSLSGSSALQRVCLRRRCIGAADEACLEGMCEPGLGSPAEDPGSTGDGE